MSIATRLIAATLTVIGSSPVLASTFTCFEAAYFQREIPVVVVDHDKDSNVGSVEAYGETYESLVWVYSPTGRLTHAYQKHAVDFRIASFVRGPRGLTYAKITFPESSSSEHRGSAVELLCRQD